MSDFETLFANAFTLFGEQKFAESLFKLAEAERHLINLETPALISGLENLKGFNYLGLQDYKEAKKCFEKALKINPDSSQACSGLGEVLYLTHDDWHAKTMYEWGVKNNKDNQFAVQGLARINRILGFQENHNSLLKVDGSEEIINSDEDVLEIIKNASALYEGEKYLEAIYKLDFAEGVLRANLDQLKQHMVDLLVMKGTGFFKIGQYDRAEGEFEKALNYNPESSQACLGLGRVFLKRKMNEEAKTMFEWSRKNDPANPEAKAELERINLKLGLPENHTYL